MSLEDGEGAKAVLIPKVGKRDSQGGPGPGVFFDIKGVFDNVQTSKVLKGLRVRGTAEFNRMVWSLFGFNSNYNSKILVRINSNSNSNSSQI